MTEIRSGVLRGASGDGAHVYGPERDALLVQSAHGSTGPLRGSPGRESRSTL